MSKKKGQSEEKKAVRKDEEPFKLRDFVRINLTKLDQSNKAQCELARMIVNS